MTTAVERFEQDPYRMFVFLRTYSRWNDELKRREVWPETVKRYFDFMRGKLGDKLTEREYEELQEIVLSQEVVPSMRLMWSSGKACAKSNVAGYNCAFIAPTKFQDFGEILYLLASTCGVGFSVESKFVSQFPEVAPILEGSTKYVVDDSREGWADALVFGISSWYAGNDVEFDYSKVRPAGARLKTMGGRSSGADPLRNLLDFAKVKILAKQGKKLLPIDVHDIVCKIGEVVVAGGVRRSAEISLSDLTDKDIRDAKKGAFYFNEPQRSLANNSAVYNEKPPLIAFMREWTALMESGSGERGIFNRGGLEAQMPERRLEAMNGYIDSTGTNPCFSPGTLIVTDKGLFPIEELVGKTVKIWDGKEWKEIDNFRITGKEQETLLIKLHDGSELKVTPEHSMILEDGSRVKAKDLSPDSRLLISGIDGVHGETKVDGAYIKGFLIGDGTSNRERPLLYLYDTKDSCEDRIIQSANEIPCGVSNTTAIDNPAFVSDTYNRKRMQGLSIRKDELLQWSTRNKESLPTETFQWCLESKTEFIAGILDADGTACDTKNGFFYQICSIHKQWLLDFQILLKTLGVQSTVRLARLAGMKDFNDGYGEYLAKDCYRLTISQVGAKKLGSLIEFSRLVNFKDKETRYLTKPRWNRVASIEPGSIESNVYCCTVPETHSVSVGNGVLTGQCGEITLRNKEFCNLTEVVARAGDTSVDLLEKVKVATILGTYQSMLTDFGYLSKEWKKNCEEERLLGVSITGQFDSKEARNPTTLKTLRDYAIKINKKYAKRFGVNQSLSVTTVKPSGTVSQLVDASSGMHPRYSPYYIRRVRIASTDPLFLMLKAQGIKYTPEVGQSEPTSTTFVLEFPIKSPKGSITGDGMTAIDQLEYWKIVKENYTEHNPSQTISVGEDEWLEVGAWVWRQWDIIGGLSFLPRVKHIYEKAPYETITKERYDEMVKAMPVIDYTQLSKFEYEDNTDGQNTSSCIGNVCEIV